MPYGKQRTLRDICNFIRKRRGGWLRTKLLTDLRRLRIVKEADVECAVYCHLRKFIGEDHRWRVLARKHVKRTGHYVDLLIFKNKHPRIAIELKLNQEQIDKKDRDSLNRAIKKLHVQRAYWISVGFKELAKVSFDKRPEEKYKLHRVFVRLGYHGARLEQYITTRKKYMSEMIPGKTRQPVTA